MTPRRLKIRAIQLAVLYVIVVCALYLLNATFREYVQAHWLRVTVVLAILVAIAIFSRKVSDFIQKTMTTAGLARLRRWAVKLAVLYVIVVCAIYLLYAPFREFVQQNWLCFVILLGILLAVALLARPWRMEVPARLRSWALQLAALYVIVVCVLYLINAPFRDCVRAHWIWTLAVLGVLLVIAFLARPRGLVLYKEYPEPDEQETINNIVNLFLRRLKKQYTGRLTLRDTHPKSNGLLFAEFEVLDLPDELRVGIFAEPKKYKCWMRFSNSEPEVTPDAEPDFRGIALKLFDVPGDKLQTDEQGTHDFLFIAHDAFFAANPKDFLDFFGNLTHYGSKFGRLFYFIPKRLRLLRNALVGRRSYGHPFEITWFSCAPYKFGDKVVKYRLHSEWQNSEPDRGNPDYLRERLTTTLDHRGHTMELMIQFQEDPNRDLIETTAIPWRVPQFRTVARLHIPQQDFNSPDHLQFDENMTFNPWHCLPEHRPVGGINRARRDVMRAIQEFRLAQNGSQRTDVNAGVPGDAPDAAKR